LKRYTTHDFFSNLSVASETWYTTINDAKNNYADENGREKEKLMLPKTPRRSYNAAMRQRIDCEAFARPQQRDTTATR
jgi:hypothetical protein